MRALTIQQPMAWSVVEPNGKGIENRSTNIAGTYRGPVAIHAGVKWNQDYARDPNVIELYLRRLEREGWTSVDREHAPRTCQREGIPVEFLREWAGCFVGVADLVGVHHDTDHSPGAPCSPWSFRGDWHLEFTNPRPLLTPIRARGFLGLWTPTPEHVTAINTQLHSNEVAE